MYKRPSDFIAGIFHIFKLSKYIRFQEIIGSVFWQHW